MYKNIFCGIGWSEFSDYPMLRKLIKEQLTFDVNKILIAVPSHPHSFGKNENDAAEFLKWLKDDFKDCKNVSVENFTINDIPEPTKYCGSKARGDISFGYMYPIEYCFDRCDQEYFLRIETDFVTTEWNKLKKFIDETDFDLINMGCLKSSPLDVSFWCLRMKSFEDHVQEKNFLNGLFGPYTNLGNVPISVSGGSISTEIIGDKTAYNINRQTDLVHGENNYNYDHFQWMMFQIMNKSDKVYVLNPKSVDIRHYMGMNQNSTGFFRTNKLLPTAEDRFYKYIQTCKNNNCYENYNIYPPHKELMDRYYSEFKLTTSYKDYPNVYLTDK